VCGVPESVRVAGGVPVNVKKRNTFVRDGLFALLAGTVLSGYGFLRFSDRPILGTVLMVVGFVNVMVSGANFGFVIWPQRGDE
jgi:hypothetical protein